jgi:glutamate---cysteine ligase / carboxylate-amine ligase
MREFQFGIEEEYFVVDRRSGRVKSNLSQPFMKAAKKKLGPSLMYELLQSQIETATTPVVSSLEARQQLTYFRATLAELGRDYNVGIVAAGTHPLALPHQQKMTPKRRYTKVAKDLGMVAWGNPLCGLHVHVEVPEPDLRVEVMHRVMPFLPLLLALSTSSPFWAGCNTGLLGYRNAANDAFPRTGFPEMFHSLKDYESYVQALVEADIIGDATYIWWALRPSLRHPTLELRITDCCTAVDDAVAIAALYRALVRHVVRHPNLNAGFCAIARALTEENRWRAQRYGTDGTYIDLKTRQAVPFEDLLNQTLDEVMEDATELGIENELLQLRYISKKGTSAHRQLELFEGLRRQGVSPLKAMQEVAKWLRASTENGSYVDYGLKQRSCSTNPILSHSDPDSVSVAEYP